MKNTILILFASLVLVACSNSQNLGLSDDHRDLQNGIVGGDEVKAGSREIFSTVGIFDKKSQSMCTGTLLSEQLVLTAAHCIGEEPKQMLIIFKDRFAKARKEDTRPVLDARQHPRYVGNITSQNIGDIALIRFDAQAGIPAGYGPAQLLSDFSLLKSGTEILAVGYGLSWAWGVKAGEGTLRKVKLTVRDSEFSDTEILVDQSLRRGVCSGDSGGPGYLVNNGQLFVWGVVSRGDSLPSRLIPSCFLFSVYTRIDVYGAWLEKASLELLNEPLN